MSGRKKSASRLRKPSDSSHLRIMEVPLDLVIGGVVPPAPFEVTGPTMLSISQPSDEEIEELTEQPTDSSESSEMVAIEAPSSSEPSWERMSVTDDRAEAEDHEGDGSHDEIVSGEAPNLLQSLDRRQNQVLEELDRLNARIDTLIAELHQQREDHQAA